MTDSKTSLADVRERIDSIDRQIQELISERANWAQEVARVKGEGLSAIDYYRPEREAHVLRMVVDRNKGPLPDAEMVRLFREIMSSCLAQEDPLKIGYLGPEGTFSEQAVRKHFGHAAYGLPLGSIEEVFQEVAAGHADFGVVPVENSGQGMIQVTLDMFLTSDARICGEIELRVHQCLHSMAGRLEDVKRVFAHAQSLQQCKTWLRMNLPDVECEAVGSNAEAARRARHADDAGAIAGETAGKVYGLKTLATGIEDRADNTTRFLVIGRSLFPPSGNDRTSLLITVNDQPGALYHVLSPFARRGVSLNRIESRPAHSGRWQYAFFIDVSGHIQDEALQAAVKEIEQSVAQLRVLGSYPVALP
ncbi:MAG: chorismate mutase [Rhodanobacter sp. 68-29]|uniref:prephenate dehydratase n=1 Tax=Rhodanobacter sp. PCA2 TaxID=2006117 RepID=UPI000868FCBC|nr:prephenate dehydratase [Rhodanobacter sp. PCA2]MBA2078530.1 chorismate mutase [Rhodanobacter sp. PCA2]MBN8921638.1 prephenate dehydratase [Rhodanobacter sp.]ODV27853.1 MAG: chorismate mutase [Rhodanobacter sp. SCN 68-63]OJY61363.1 MAG: chorismate mutase [Rhodanobacter sp. 68-29]